MKKRIIGFLLACVMMLTLLPTMAFASTTTLKVSLSKNYPNAPVSAIIEETGVFSWKAGEKMHGMSQSS